MCRWGRSCAESEARRMEGTEGTEDTERALKTETRRHGDGYAGDHRSAADAGPAIGRAERSIDAPRTQAAPASPAACVRGASIDRPPRSGGIGGPGDTPPNSQICDSPPCLRFSEFEARSVSSVPSVPQPVPSMTYFQPLDFRVKRAGSAGFFSGGGSGSPDASAISLSRSSSLGSPAN